jgi:hypothetical protein
MRPCMDRVPFCISLDLMVKRYQAFVVKMWIKHVETVWIAKIV